MDLKYTEVSKQIGLAASHIEFDSQGDSILIDCYHLSCLEKCHKSKLLFSHILHHLLVHLLIDIVNCCSWDFIRGVWIQNVAETWIRVCDNNLCSWHWLRGIVILNPGHQTWNSFSSQLWQWIQTTRSPLHVQCGHCVRLGVLLHRYKQLPRVSHIHWLDFMIIQSKLAPI